MESGQVTVIARFKAKPGSEGALRKELLALLGPSRSDEGCINYDLHQAFDDPSVFAFHENWRSREHLERHSATPHVQAFRQRVKDLLAAPPELLLLEKIES